MEVKLQIKKLLVISLTAIIYIYILIYGIGIKYLLVHIEVMIIAIFLITLVIYQICQLLHTVFKKEAYNKKYSVKIILTYGVSVLCLCVFILLNNHSETISALALSKEDVPFLTLKDIQDKNVDFEDASIWSDIIKTKNVLLNEKIDAMEGIPSRSDLYKSKNSINGIKTEYYDLKISFFSKPLLLELKNQNHYSKQYIPYNSNVFDEFYYCETTINNEMILTLCFRFDNKVVFMQCYGTKEMNIDYIITSVETWANKSNV